MNIESALLVLKNEKEKLHFLINDGHNLPKHVTKYKHDIASIDFAIEILNQWKD